MLTISITNMMDKTEGNYKDLPLYVVLRNFDMIYFSEYVEELLKSYNDNPNSYSERIDLNIDSSTIARYNLPFDSFTITLYRKGWELEKGFTSNYMYNEFDGNRSMWIDLYYSKEDYDSEDVARDIMRELVNCFYRDLKEYLNEN